MNLLHRHIFLSVLLTCAAAVGVFVFVLIAGTAVKDLLGYALAGQLPLDLFFSLLLLLVPYVLTYALPLGVLTGTLLVLGRMSAQHEITAMRAAGLGLGYIARPVLLLGGVLALFTLEINYDLMPRARSTYIETRNNLVRKNPLQFIVPKTFIRDFPGVVFYVREKAGNEMRDVWAWKLDAQQRVTVFLHAERGRLDFDERANTIQLTLLGHVLPDRRNPDDPENFSNADFQAVTDTWPFPPQKLDTIVGPQTTLKKKNAWLTWDELLAEGHRLDRLPAATDPAEAREQAQTRMRVSIAVHEKAAGALTVFAFALVAVPLGIRVSRKETSANLVVGVGLAMGFYLLSESLHWLEKYPADRPDLLQWFPPALLFGLAAWLFRRAGRV